MIFIALVIMKSSRGQFLSFIFYGKSKGKHQFTDDNLTKLVLSFVSTLQGEKVKKGRGHNNNTTAGCFVVQLLLGVQVVAGQNMTALVEVFSGWFCEKKEETLSIFHCFISRCIIVYSKVDRCLACRSQQCNTMQYRKIKYNYYDRRLKRWVI